MNTWTRKAAWIVLVLLLCLLVAAGLAYRALWMRYDGALLQFESRSERLDGVVQAGEEIQQRLDVVRSAIAPMLHPSGENAQNDVQQSLRELITRSGVTLVSSQAVLEPGVDGKLNRIRLTATVTGEWMQLVRFTEKLQAQRPPYWVRSAIVSREGSNAPGGPQNARMALQLDAPLAPQKAQP